MASQYALEAHARVLARDGYGIEDIRVKLSLHKDDEKWIREIVLGKKRRVREAS